MNIPASNFTNIGSPGHPLFVKICGVRTPADVEAVVSAGADAIGFVFQPSSRRRIDLEQARALSLLADDVIERVGVFVDTPADEIVDVVNHVSLSIIQLHGGESPELCGWLINRTNCRLIKAFRVRDGVLSPDPGRYNVDAHLLDSWGSNTGGGSGKSFDWNHLKRHAGADRRLRPTVLAGGLTPENVGVAVDGRTVDGVDVSSGVELNGQKSPAQIRRFVQAAKSATPKVLSVDLKSADRPDSPCLSRRVLET